MIIKKIDIADIDPAPYNPRKDLQPDDPEYKKIERSIEKFGCVQALVWNKRSGTLVGGHQRLKILKARGDKKVTVSVVDLGPDDERALNIVLNNPNVAGSFDDEKLAALLKELDGHDYDLEETGFEPMDVEEIYALIDHPQEGETDDDAVPDPPKKAITKPGDLWILGEHRVLCGDATKADDVALVMDGAKADMVFTDPPYSVGIGAKNRTLQEFQKAGRITTDVTNDNKSVEDTAENVWRPSFENISKTLKNGGAYYICAPQGGDQMMMMMMMMMMMKGFIPCRHELIWLKNQPTFSLGRLDYDYKHEPILYGWKGSHKFQGRGEHTKSVWVINRERKCDLHPTMKPVELIENAILNSVLAGQSILDPFLGSGSTLIAAEKLGRHCYGLEIEPLYCDVIVKRWEDFTGKKAKLENTRKETV